jgi:Fe-S-cluster containining protein
LKNFAAFFRFALSKLLTSRFLVRGKCRQCGTCCRNIVFLIGEEYITTEKQFDVMRNWDKKYNHFFISGRNEKGALLFTCKSLCKDNKCKDYFLRSIYCRIYPKLDKKIVLGGFETLEGCGYNIEIDKKFKDYLQ